MRRIGSLALVLALLGVVGCAAARTPGQQSQSNQEKDKQKKKPKKEEPVPGPGESPDATAADRRAISRVLRDFADGFEGKSPRRVTEKLDENFDDLPRFEDQVTQFLEQSGEMRVFVRESSGEVQGDRAILIVDAEMVYSTKRNPAREQKRKERIQFDFNRTNKGWKIFEVTPRRFFTP